MKNVKRSIHVGGLFDFSLKKLQKCGNIVRHMKRPWERGVKTER